MTVAKDPKVIEFQSLLQRGGEKYDHGPAHPALLPNRFPVMLYKGMVPVYGHVVTHLSIKDWCDMHGYKLGEVYQGTRIAYKGEVTDLF